MHPLFESAVRRVAGTVKPLLFETGIAVALYSQAGTAFLMGRRGRAVAVTCRHALRPDHLYPVCLFPDDQSQKFLPLTQVSYAPALFDDFADLAIIEVDMASAVRHRQGHAGILNLDMKLPEWKSVSHTTDFVVLGFPGERSYIDYDDVRIHSELVALYGRYVGPSVSAHVHTMTVQEMKGLASLSGFSGGPVFALLRRVGQLPILLFCGMAIQGSASSRLIHFLDASSILDAVETW